MSIALPGMALFRKYVPDRYAMSFLTPDGSMPATTGLDDVCQEDRDVAQLVERYIQRGEALFTRLTWVEKTYLSHAYYSAQAQELFEAAQLAMLARGGGGAMVAALLRHTNSITDPQLHYRRERLMEVAVAALRNGTVPKWSFACAPRATGVFP